MANPNPAHNPTDGLGSACIIQASGTGLVAYSTPTSAKPDPVFYSVTLSVAGTAPNSSSVVVTPSLVDVKNNAYSATAGSWVYRSYNNPQITEATANTTQSPYIAPKPTATAKIASVGASGVSTVTITALSPGQAIVEILYPTFDNTEGSINQGNLGGASAGSTVPKDNINQQIIVTVVP